MNHILSFIPSDPMRLVACAEAVLLVVLWQLRWYRAARLHELYRAIRRVMEG